MIPLYLHTVNTLQKDRETEQNIQIGRLKHRFIVSIFQDTTTLLK